MFCFIQVISFSLSSLKGKEGEAGNLWKKENVSSGLYVERLGFLYVYLTDEQRALSKS